MKLPLGAIFPEKKRGGGAEELGLLAPAARTFLLKRERIANDKSHKVFPLSGREIYQQGATVRVPGIFLAKQSSLSICNNDPPLVPGPVVRSNYSIERGTAPKADKCNVGRGPPGSLFYVVTVPN